MGMKKLVLTALEIRRRYSEASAVHVDEQPEVQRQRSPNTDWLDWAALFLKPLDELSAETRQALYRLHREPLGRFSNAEYGAMEQGFRHFEQYYDAPRKRRILAQGYTIASKH